MCSQIEDHQLNPSPIEETDLRLVKASYPLLHCFFHPRLISFALPKAPWDLARGPLSAAVTTFPSCYSSSFEAGQDTINISISLDSSPAESLSFKVFF